MSMRESLLKVCFLCSNLHVFQTVPLEKTYDNGRQITIVRKFVLGGMTNATLLNWFELCLSYVMIGPFDRLQSKSNDQDLVF